MRARRSRKGQVEAVQIVILDDVRIRRLHCCNQPANQVGLGRVARAAGLEHFGGAGRVAHGDHEHAVAGGVESGGFQIELEAMQLIE